MVYGVLADAVMVVHLAFIVFVAAGALMTWAWPRTAWVHLPALAWGVGSVTVGFPCPLTSLEKALERRSDGHSYNGGFVDRYLEDVLFPGEYSSMIRGLAAGVIVFGYVGLLRRIHMCTDMRRTNGVLAHRRSVAPGPGSDTSAMPVTRGTA